MTQQALDAFQNAVNRQRDLNDARRIRTRVEQARRDRHTAGIRWPFELLQNALDAGPREGRPGVSVCLRQDRGRVRFEHDGAPFSSQELAALLSGGSSKELESVKTTGRFGTGFLVTHVLAEQTHVTGLLSLATGYERFDITLDRQGSEEAILRNIRLANSAIKRATPTPTVTDEPSAAFEYVTTDSDSWHMGLRELERALPYLYLTRPALGRVEIQTASGDIRVWRPKAIRSIRIDGGFLQRRDLSAERSGELTQCLSVLQFSQQRSADAAVLVLLEKRQDDAWRVRIPEDDAPRVFRSYPLRDSVFLPVNVVIDGTFTPDQERSGVTMDERDKTLFESALRAGVIAVHYATTKRWEMAHRLAEAASPSRGFHASNEEEPRWWKATLATFARDLANNPIVACGDRYLPAVSQDGESASFLDVRLQSRTGDPETTMERVWPLADAALALQPPSQYIAADWTRTVRGWGSLGLQIPVRSVAELGRIARGSATTLAEIEVSSEKQQWLADWLDIVGECWDKQPSDLAPLRKMLPNQKGDLCGPTELRRDAGISESLKDICAEAGLDIRERLLLGDLETTGEARNLHHLRTAIRTAVAKEDTEAEVREELVDHIVKAVEIGKPHSEPIPRVLSASIPLLSYLAAVRAPDSESLARRLPLMTLSGHVDLWSHRKRFMAPVAVWPEASRPFAEAYPPERVLASTYAEGKEADGVTSALAQWDIAHTDPLIRTRHELEGSRLAHLLAGNVDPTDLSVPETTLSQIAFLGDVLLNQCAQNPVQATALLGLVLCYIAQADQAWHTPRTVSARRSGVAEEVQALGALWLADLKVRAWVPVSGDDGSLQGMSASAVTLKDLLDAAWLHNNPTAAKLLSEWFGFDRLELRLMGVPEDKRVAMRDSLVGFIETVGNDPDRIEAIALQEERRKEHRRDVDRCRRLGIAIQEAVAALLRAYSLDVELVDRGYDYLVGPDYQDQDVGIQFEVGPYLVEVKATTTGRVRLTPLQAATASSEVERYVLCVVDLRGVPTAERTTDWSSEEVEPLASLVADIGASVYPTYSAVEEARTADVGLRNDAALRYEVPPAIWETGSSVAAWVATIERQLRASTAGNTVPTARHSTQ